MNYLLLVAIGPVQDFIASARRSRDLWFSSWLLSELSKAAARSINQQGGALIFPAPPDPIGDLAAASDFTVANKILATIDVPHIHTVATAVQDAMRDELTTICRTTYDRLSNQQDFDRALAERQVHDLVEYSWVALPFTGETSYADRRARLDALMEARKMTRDFAPVPWGSDRPKSSLDGLREAVIHKKAYAVSPPKLRKQYGVRPGEHLCGVGLLKRHGVRVVGGKDHRFFSTSHVAALPLLARMTDADKHEVDTYIKSLQWLEPDDLGQVPGSPHPAFGQYDGHLLFEERLAEFFEDTTRLRDARRALKHLLDKTVDGRRPLPYYALLQADGDQMGALIKNQPDRARHRALSQHLAHFAGKVRHIIADHRGWLIYTGGDDVLAFVPLHTVLACVRMLADTFSATFSSPAGAPQITHQDGSFPTLSVGIAVAHHMEPMSDVLALARRAEQAAKKTRNALAITLSKRSGADRTVVGSWAPAPGLAQEWSTLDQRLHQFVILHNAEAFPDGAAYELHDLYRRVGATLPAEALQAEAMRVLKRKRAQRGETRVDETTIQHIATVLQRSHMTLEHLAHEIIIARIFADAQRLADADTATRQREEPS